MVYDPLGIYPKKKKKRKPVSRGSLRDLYARAGGECERCGAILRGLKGHIHHKNRKKSDNRLSNLILLCPNCHSKAHKNDKPTQPRPPKNPLGIPTIRIPKSSGIWGIK